MLRSYLMHVHKSAVDLCARGCSQVFKPLYYWRESRDKVMAEPKKVLRSDGLAGHAFMMHPFKLSGVSLFFPDALKLLVHLSGMPPAHLR